MDVPELSRLLENLIRIGTIHSVNLPKERVRVQSGKLVTQWLRFVTCRAGTTRTWSPPTVGEQCIVFSPSGEVGNGIVLVGINSDGHPAPDHSPDTDVTLYPDGARIEYNHASGALSASGIKTGTIQAETSITLDTPETTITGKCTIDGLLTYKDGLRGSGGGPGNVVTGDFIHDGGILSSHGIVLSTHNHDDPPAGKPI